MAAMYLSRMASTVGRAVFDAADGGTSTICAFTGGRVPAVVDVRVVLVPIEREALMGFGVENDAACAQAFANSAGVRFLAPRRNG